MARRLILDAGVLIAAERGTLDLAKVLDDDDDCVVAAVTVAELLTGVELADRTRRAARQEVVDGTLRLFPLAVYDLPVAAAHARLLAWAHRSGRPRGALDLIVAATAASTGRCIVTTDAHARFDELPGVEAVVVSD